MYFVVILRNGFVINRRSWMFGNFIGKISIKKVRMFLEKLNSFIVYLPRA